VAQSTQNLFAKISHGLRRDRDLPVSERLRKGVRLVTGSIAARLALRECDLVGPGARVSGQVRVENRGSISIGPGLSLVGSFIPVELLTAEQGRIELGSGVWINFGCVFSARAHVKVGDESHFGQHCIIADSENPETTQPDPFEAKPIEIGKRVWVAGRVTIRPGVKIGDDAVITAGSVVETDIPAGVIAGGVPARVLRSINEAPAAVAATKAEIKANGAPAAAAVMAPPVVEPKSFGSLISDSTVDELAGELAAPGVHPPLGAWVAPFGQVQQMLLGEPHEGFADFALIWVRPETVAPSFARVMAHEAVDEATLLAEVDAFTALIERAAPKYKLVFVPSLVLPPWIRGRGMTDLRPGGVQRSLLALNTRLADNLHKLGNVFMLDGARWYQAGGYQAKDHKAWYLGKMSANTAIMAEAAADIRAAVAGAAGGARKLLVLDLDDTMWGGIVGDVGWEGLKLGGLDAEGEAHVDFQRAVKALKRRGVVLAIASKNEESVALEAIRTHPEMVLREEDFVAWKINWTDKAKNILDLTQELNLGLQSVVFIDDNPVERARVREALPEVLVPEWPQEKHLYPSALHELRVWDAPSLSEEDLLRTQMYQQERAREQLQQQLGSVDDWLKSLEIKVKAEPLAPGNLTRAAQLLNKTNQLNLTTRRLTDAELMEWTRGPNRSFWAVSVSDRFGDAGLTGLVSLEVDGESATVVDYVLSCRVMGRRVEETMVHMLVTAAKAAGARTLTAKLLPTKKNKPCLTFWQKSGFDSPEENVFRWDLDRNYELPHTIDLQWTR
jgi:FkbH-like protein